MSWVNSDASKAALLDLIGSGVSAAGAAGISSSQGKRSDRQLKAQMIDQMLSEQSRQDLERQMAGLQSTQMNPWQQNKYLLQANILHQLLGGATNAGYSFDPSSGMGSFTGGIRIPEGGLDVNAVSPESLAEGARSFYSNVGTISPETEHPRFFSDVEPDIQNARVDSAGRISADRTQRQKLIEQNLKGGGGGGSWWKTALGLGALAVPFVGPALGMSALGTSLLGAGVGAASGAASGGARGALTGAATGALSGYAGAKKPLFKFKPRMTNVTPMNNFLSSNVTMPDFGAGKVTF